MGRIVGLNIKNAEAERLAAEVGKLAGESKTAAVVVSLRERRERLIARQRQAPDAELVDELLELAARIRSRLPDAELSSDFLYDPQTGLPA